MKLYIRKLEIQNFRSIQSKVTVVVNNGLFCIEGINYDEKNSTNGIGKSTICSALFWAITGSPTTNEVLADEVVNSDVNKDCKVVVYIESSAGDVIITRTRKDTELGNTLSLEINGQDLSCHKMVETQERINNFIKIPAELLRNTILMTSGMESAFSSLTPQQRVQVLESIRDYSVWENIKNIAKTDISNYDKQLKELEAEKNVTYGSILSYTSISKMNKQQLDELIAEYNNSDLTSDLKAQQAKLQWLYDEKAKLNIEYESLTDSDKTLDALRVEYSAINNSINKLELDKQAEIHSLDENISKLSYEKTNLINQRNVLIRWEKEDTCPTCHRKLDRTQDEIITNSDKQSILAKQIQDVDVEILTFTKKKEIIISEFNIKLAEQKNKQLEITNKVNTIKEEESKRQEKQNEIKTTISQFDKRIFDKNKDIQTIQYKIDSYEQTKQHYITTINENTTKISELQAKEINLDTQIKEIEIKKARSNFFYKLLGSKGELRPYLLAKDIAFLNDRMQKYIHRFFTNTDVELCLNNGVIDIKILSNNKTQKSISRLSGGEMKRVDISIQLALYDLIQTVAQVNFNILCLDEIETQMDDLGCEQLIEIIEDKAENIDTVWWITNNGSVKQSIPQKILVTKKLGKTEITQE